MRTISSIAALTIALGVAGLCPANCPAQSNAVPGMTISNSPAADVNTTPPPIQSQKPESGGEIGKVGVALKMSSLGAGFEMGTSVAQKLNIRGGFNAFSYSRGFGKDGIQYSGSLDLRSADLLLDWFPFGGGFHLSPGALIYNGNAAHANASVPAGQSFTLGGTTYQSDTTNPVTGKGNLDFVKAAPMILFGWGNLAPRHRHFVFSIETGVVFQGTPRAKLALAGTACQVGGTGCVDAATDPGVQSSVLAEQTKLNNSLSPIKYYPIISIGTGYRF